MGVARLSPGVQGGAPEADGVPGAGAGLQLQQTVVSVQADGEAPHRVQGAVLRYYLQGAWAESEISFVTNIVELDRILNS